MNILALSAKAQKFYEGARGRNLHSGYEKNVLVREDSESCLFVDASYKPQPGDVIFRCMTINQATRIDLAKTYTPPRLKGKFSKDEWFVMVNNMNGVLPSPELDAREEVAGELSDELAAKVRDLSCEDGKLLLTIITEFWDTEKHFEKFVTKLL